MRAAIVSRSWTNWGTTARAAQRAAKGADRDTPLASLPHSRLPLFRAGARPAVRVVQNMDAADTIAVVLLDPTRGMVLISTHA